MNVHERATSRVGARVETWLHALSSLQVSKPSWPILVCAAVALLGLWRASKLALKTQFDQLLPQSEPSVVELHRVAERTRGISNVFVVLEGDDGAALRKMGDAIVPKLRAIGPPLVGSADDGVQEARTFLRARAGLFAAKAELEKLRADVDARWDYEVAKAMGTQLDDEEPPPPIDADRLKRAFGGRDDADDRYPDGYFQSKDGTKLVVVARSGSAPGDLEGSRETLRRVEGAVDEVRKDPAFSAIRVGYAGDLVTGLFEYGAIRDDLVSVGTLGVGLVLGVIFLYYVRLRTLLALGVTIFVGLAWTFGVTQLAIGHLNVATGFLVSIVAGNGINFGIIFMARYLEERRAARPVGEALRVAHETTWVPTLTAALAAAASYGSLGVTDFLGFKHFAVIGVSGMVLCWIATYALLPAVLVVLERVRPFETMRESAGRLGFFTRLRRGGTRYDAPFAFLVPRAPRVIAISGVALAVAGTAASIRWVQRDPLEYDMRKLQNDLGRASDVYRVSAVARDVLGANTESGMVVLADRLDQVVPLKAALDRKRDAAPKDERPFEAVHTLFDFVPDDQEAKLPTLRAIAARVRRARQRGFVKDADWRDIQPFLPPDDVRAFGIRDLPEDVARPFTEKDGTRGRLVFIEPTAGKDDNDLHYLLRFADSFRETRLPNGETVRGSGRAVIFADMLKAVLSDMPKAIVLSFAMTALAVLFTFRRGGRSLVVLASLVIGVLWLGGLVALAGVRLNFLNFVALPITFGIGVDYAVNFVQRWSSAGGGVTRALRTTGGAVVLCSATTILGYLALLGSLNQAVRSLGLVAVLGEICCLVAALLVVPAALRWREERAARVEGGQRAKAADEGVET